MDPVPVNWEALDSLVVDFIKSENLVVDYSSSSALPSTASSSSSYRSRLLIHQIRGAIEIGDIDAAIDLLHHHVPSILDDQRLLFRLQKQKFIEILRKGSANDRDSAIECLRTSFAPCALNAYPEAYEEFKHTLLALIFDKEDQASPVADLWFEARRSEIAGLLSLLLRSHLNAYDPLFSLTLRYLISVHKGFCFRQGIKSSISDLTERLLLEERDPPAIPQESLCEAPPFDEVDIQALAHAIELTRQGAVDSLRFSKGDLFKAFKNELSRIKLNVPMLDQMVHEYCVYRGIVSSVHGFHSDLEYSSRDSSCLSLEGAASKQSDGEISDTTSTISTDVELRFSNESANSIEDCSTSELQQLRSSSRRPQRSHNLAADTPYRKRWRGRTQWEDIVYEACFPESSKEEISSQDTSGSTSEEKQISTRDRNVEITRSKVCQNYEIILEMRDLVHKGMTAVVVDEVNSIDASFFVQNPDLLFQLKQVEFLKLVSAGDFTKALRVACSHMGPLAATNPYLLKPLKETLLVLLRPNENATIGVSLSVLATSLQVAMGRRLGIEEPRLMKIMRETLHMHTEWFKPQMCKDRFEEFLKIDYLKELDAPLSAAASLQNASQCVHGCSQITVSSTKMMVEEGGTTGQALPREVICDESAILKVMEFLALPRADAIHLLAQYNGNAETVIQQIFA